MGQNTLNDLQNRGMDQRSGSRISRRGPRGSHMTSTFAFEFVHCRDTFDSVR